MKHIKLFESFSDELKQDIDGLLVELTDTGKVGYNISDVNNSLSRDKPYKVITFYSNETGWIFGLKYIQDYLKTIEDYLKSKGHKFSYEYEYESSKSDETFFGSCNNINAINNNIRLVYLYLTIFNNI